MTATTKRPCGNCDRVKKGQPHSSDQCPFCWQFYHSPKYNRLWGGDGNVAPVQGGKGKSKRMGRLLPCVFLGDLTGETLDCQGCGAPRQVEVYGCEKHGKCTRGHKVGPEVTWCKICQNYLAVTLPPGPVARPGDPRCGVVVGLFRWRSLAELQIQAIRQTCGLVPILIAEDPDGEQESTVAELARDNPGVWYWPNVQRIGHTGGDLSAFWRGLTWARNLGLAVLAKLSMRAFPLRKRWLQEGAKGLLGSGLALGGQPCRGGENFPLRTECCLLDVERWSRPEVLHELRPRRLTKQQNLEWTVAGAHNRFLGREVWRWNLLGEDRYTASPDLVWHCSHARAAYDILASQLGVELDPGFTTAGWQWDKRYLYG